MRLGLIIALEIPLLGSDRMRIARYMPTGWMRTTTFHLLSLRSMALCVPQVEMATHPDPRGKRPPLHLSYRPFVDAFFNGRLLTRHGQHSILHSYQRKQIG